MSDITDEDRDALAAAFRDAVTDERIAPINKKARALADDIAESIEYSVRDYLATNLAYHVKEMAGRAVQAMLDGNADEMERWLNCDSRHTGRGDDPTRDQHPVIHGKLFEPGAIRLRRRLVEAHRDLITDQRVLDLEDQVRSLVAQVNKANVEKERILERARAGEFA